MRPKLLILLFIGILVWRSYAPSNYVGNPTFATSLYAGFKLISSPGVTSPYVVQGNDYFLLITGNSYAIFLPSSVKNKGRIIAVSQGGLNTYSSGVNCTGTDHIGNGNQTFVAISFGQSVTLQADGAGKWWLQ